MPLAVFENIPSGFAGTRATVQRMHDFAHKGKIDLQLQQIADSIVQKSGCGNREYECKAKAIYDFVKKYIRFERDPFGVEMVQEPFVTLKRRAGDCDDHATLLASLYGSIGFPYGFKTIKSDKTRRDEFSHIYTVVDIPNKGWVGADTSVDKASFGWEPEKYFSSKIWYAGVEA